MVKAVRETRRLLQRSAALEARQKWAQAYECYESIGLILGVALFDIEKLFADNGIAVDEGCRRALACERKAGGTMFAKLVPQIEARRRDAPNR